MTGVRYLGLSIFGRGATSIVCSRNSGVGVFRWFVSSLGESNLVRWSLFPTFGPTASTMAFLIGLTLYPQVGDVLDGRHTEWMRLVFSMFTSLPQVSAGLWPSAIHMSIAEHAVKISSFLWGPWVWLRRSPRIRSQVSSLYPDQLFGVGALAHRGLPPFIGGLCGDHSPHRTTMTQTKCCPILHFGLWWLHLLSSPVSLPSSISARCAESRALRNLCSCRVSSLLPEQWTLFHDAAGRVLVFFGTHDGHCDRLGCVSCGAVCRSIRFPQSVCLWFLVFAPAL